MAGEMLEANLERRELLKSILIAKEKNCNKANDLKQMKDEAVVEEGNLEQTKILIGELLMKKNVEV